MPPPPLIASNGLRAVTLTVITTGLLTLALLTAALVTGAPLQRPRLAPPPPIDLHGAVLAPPAGWVLAQTLHNAKGVDTGWELIDTSEPGRRLRIYRVAVTAEATPTGILTSVLPRLIAGRRPITRFKTPDRADDANADLFEIFFSTRRLSPVGDDGSPQVHAIAAVRPNPSRCWVIQLTTLMSNERWNEQAERDQMRELHRILDRLTIDPG